MGVFRNRGSRKKQFVTATVARHNTYSTFWTWSVAPWASLKCNALSFCVWDAPLSCTLDWILCLTTLMMSSNCKTVFWYDSSTWIHLPGYTFWTSLGLPSHRCSGTGGKGTGWGLLSDYMSNAKKILLEAARPLMCRLVWWHIICVHCLPYCENICWMRFVYKTIIDINGNMSILYYIMVW